MFFPSSQTRTATLTGRTGSLAALIGGGLLVASLPCFAQDVPAAADTTDSRPSEAAPTETSPAETEASPPAEARVEATVESRLYLGLQLAPLPEALAAHLDRDEGLMIEAVLPDSPAAKAGVKKYDVLLTYNGVPIEEISDLTDAVNAAGRTAGTLTVIHRGESTTLTVTPEPMPADLAARTQAPEAPVGEMFWMGPARIMPGFPGVGPGQGAVQEQDFAITMSKDGDGPTKITVRRGGETFKTTADKLDVLPEDVRPAVERALANNRLPAIRGLGEGALPGGAFRAGPFGTPAGFGPEGFGPPANQEEFRRMFEQMREDMRKMQDDMHKMLEQRGDPQPEKPAGVET